MLSLTESSLSPLRVRRDKHSYPYFTVLQIEANDLPEDSILVKWQNEEQRLFFSVVLFLVILQLPCCKGLVHRKLMLLYKYHAEYPFPSLNSRSKVLATKTCLVPKDLL